MITPYLVELLIAKYPPFDNSWSDELRTVWLTGFVKLYDSCHLALASETSAHPEAPALPLQDRSTKENPPHDVATFELLAALKKILWEVEHRPTGLSQTLTEVHWIARNAIAKAEGR